MTDTSWKPARHKKHMKKELRNSSKPAKGVRTTGRIYKTSDCYWQGPVPNDPHALERDPRPFGSEKVRKVWISPFFDKLSNDVLLYAWNFRSFCVHKGATKTFNFVVPFFN
jgi:hypothetical protein